MSDQYEPKVTDTTAPAARPARAGLVDLLAFLGALALAGGLALLVDRTSPLSARLAFAGAAGLVAACVTAWRRLRRLEPRRWRSGQVVYRGRRVALVSAWGVEGQVPPAIEPPTAPSSTTPPRSAEMLKENEATVHEENKATVHAGHGKQHHAGHAGRERRRSGYR
jgi:hypothetical protein